MCPRAKISLLRPGSFPIARAIDPIAIGSSAEKLRENRARMCAVQLIAHETRRRLVKRTF